MNNSKNREDLLEKLNECKIFRPSRYPWRDIHNFDEMSQYVYFLDTAGSQEELIEGLTELSPFADDALAVAQGMTNLDFAIFKLALLFERRGEGNKMPKQFASILLPDRFVPAILLAEKARTPLGTALVRILEVELEI